MHSALKNLFGAGKAATEKVEAVDLEGIASKLEASEKQVETLMADILAKDSLIEELNGKIEAVKEFATQMEAAAEVAKLEAEAKELADRKQQLADVMGSESPDLEAEFEIVKGLNADVFNLVLKSKVEAKEALAKSDLFKEVGASGSGDSNVQAESATARLLKQKYQNS